MIRSAPEGAAVQALAGPLDVGRLLPAGEEGEKAARRGLSAVAVGLVGSEILKIAADVRALQAQGREVCNLTVGDFAPSEFRIPSALEASIVRLLQKGETNYPPSDGVLSVREAVADYYARDLGLEYPVSSVVITGGARPVIYATYRTLVEPGDRVVYPLPSWNNNHYTFMSGAVPVEVDTRVEDDFLPTADRLRPAIAGARLLALNTPLNPTGTALSRDALTEIAVLVVEENRRRAARAEKPLFVMFDQVYWMLTFGGTRHHTPVELVPEIAPYVVFVDGISKAFAATGLRVGWTVAPPYIAARMRDILGHVGAWAPRAEQIAAGELLLRPAVIADYHATMKVEVQARLEALYGGFRSMRARGLPVDAIPPQGAIYLSARFDLSGRRLPGGALVTTNEQVRQYLLSEAGIAVVPFQAFGLKAETGWFRLSVGAVSEAGITAALPRVESALSAVR